MASELFSPPSRAFDANGDVLPGSKWFFYATGTTTLQAVYADSALTTPLSNPVVADSGGKFPPIYFDTSKTYRGVLKSADGATTTYDLDPINTTALSLLAAANGSTLVADKGRYPSSQARTSYLRFRDTAHINEWGVAGDGVTDDTAKINAAIAEVQSGTTRPQRLMFGPGQFKVGAISNTINQALTLEGEHQRATRFVCSGSSPILSITGAGSRAPAGTIRNIGFDATAMTAGEVIKVDWTQDVLLDNVYILSPYNGVSIRQAGNVRFNDVLIDGVRGGYGVSAFANNTTRNGENDQIDVVVFTRSVIQSTLPAVGGTNSVVLLKCDGRVQTIQCDGLRLLNGGIGLQLLNTPGLAANLTPRFVVGSALDIENMYAECIDGQAFREITPAFLFAVGSHTADGVKLSANGSVFAPVRCSINSNFLHGLNVNGCKSVHLNKPLIYNNSLVGAGSKSGVYVQGSGLVSIEGGLSGKEQSLPAYTEPQKYGVELDAGWNGILQLDGVDLRSNNVGSLYDNGGSATGSFVRACPGYNPVGAVNQAPGASPYSYTAGLAGDYVNLYGGTVSSVVIDGQTIATATPCSFYLPPTKTAVITYSVAPTMKVTKG